MRMRFWSALLAVPLFIAGGLVFAGVQPVKGFVCPVTGEVLPCSKCCPLNNATKSDGYVCPATGETLPCEKCCPLNK
jgi:hypothetical protein